MHVNVVIVSRGQFQVSHTGLPSVRFLISAAKYTTCLLSLSHPRAGQEYTQAETVIQHHNSHDMHD